MSRPARIARNPRVVAHHIEGVVWGLYHLDRGTSLFIDEISWQLLDMADSFASLEDLRAACQSSLGDAAPGLFPDLDRRIGDLVEIEAILPALPSREMDVLLIDPPCPPRMMGARGPAKGLCYLSQALREHGLPPARILDLRSVSDRLGDSRAAQVEYLAHHAGRCTPGIVGITAVSATIDNALFMAQQAKLLYPEARIVLGGPHASYEWQSLLAQNPWIDFVVLGEGEIPFPRLVERIAGRTQAIDFSDVPGIAWRNPAGEAVTSGWCHGLDDLDQIPFPDDRADLLNTGDYEFGYPRILTGRGCPFKCSFCSTATFTGRRVRQRSIPNVVEEVLFYWRTYGIRHLTFDDDIFTVRRKRTLGLCAALRAAECAGLIEWGCNTRMDCIDEELIDAMHGAGCRWILFGIESGDAQVQQRFGKGRRSLIRFREKLERLIVRGIEPQLNFILGLPGESRTSLRRILSLIEGLHPVSCTFNFLNVFPGTPLAGQMDDLGIRLVGPSVQERYSLTAPTLSTPTMSSEEQAAAYLELQWTRKRERAAWEDRQRSIAC